MMMATSPSSSLPHTPVMLDEVLETLAPLAGHMVDATFGRGGYTRALLDQGVQVTALDRDERAIAFGRTHFAAELASQKLTLVHACFSALDHVVEAASLDGVVFDFGLSSPQLDEDPRGFSFEGDAPLDMRMGLSEKTAADFLNTASEKEIADVLYHLGGERRSRILAKKMIEKRRESPFARTRDVTALFVGQPRHGRLNPATRTFQALRMWVNDEVHEIETALPAVAKVLKPGGRFVAVSFHELEDRPVKHFLKPPVRGQAFRHRPETFEIAPVSLFEVSGRQPLKPSKEEVVHNPRARSARLRWGVRKDLGEVGADCDTTSSGKGALCD